MQGPRYGKENVTAAFAAAFAASPLLRRYAADTAVARASGDDALEQWEDRLRLYPHKPVGWARVERMVALTSAYWELIIGQANRATADESGSERRRRRRHGRINMQLDDATAEVEERKQRLKQLFGDDFRDAGEKELGRVPLSSVNQPPQRGTPGVPTPPSDDDDDPLAGRRVRKQQSTSEMEQLLDIGARFDGLWTLVDGVRKGSLGASITPGKLCIARRDFPAKYIVCDQAYEVVEIYYQGIPAGGAEVQRVAVPSLDARPPEGCAGFSLYLKLYSKEYHTAPVTVRPEEVGLVSLGEEVLDSLKIGLPILGVWLLVISSLVAYGEATG